MIIVVGNLEKRRIEAFRFRHSPVVVARVTVLADVPVRGLPHLDIVLCVVAALLSHVGLIQRSALRDVDDGLARRLRPVVLGLLLRPRGEGWSLLELDDRLDRLLVVLRPERQAGCNVVRAVHADKLAAVPDAALDGAQQAAGLLVAGLDLDADDLVSLLLDAVGLAVPLHVQEVRDLLGQSVALVAELAAGAVDVVRVAARSAGTGVHLKVVESPGLGNVCWARDASDLALDEADNTLLARAGGLSDDSRHRGLTVD